MRIRKSHISIPHPGNTPIVNHNNFSDVTLTGSAYNPGAKAGPMPDGPQKHTPGQSRVQKNVSRGITNTKVPH